MIKKNLPKDVIDKWPEIFSEVDIKVVPLKYLHSLRIIFKDGKIWDINIASHIRRYNVIDLESHLQELLNNYAETIEHIDYRLDIDRVKKDVIKKTKTFMKKDTKKKK